MKPHNTPRKPRTLTPDEIAAFRSMASAGQSLREIQRTLRMGPAVAAREIQKHQIVFKPWDGTRHLSAEEETLFLHMVKNHCTQEDLKVEFRMNLRTVRRLLDEYGIETNPHPRDMFKRKKVTTVPVTDLQAHVDRLRRKYSTVHAEHTAARCNEVPRPYTADTLFVVGNRRGVTADELVRMAA